MKPALRQQARQLALQGLYAWLMTNNDLAKIELDIATENDMTKVDLDYFKTLLHDTAKQHESLDATIKPYLGRLPEELDPIEKSILRLSTYELVERIDVPYKVVINEAIELAKVFGAQESHKFVNGVLDKAVRKIRQHERK